MWWYVAICMILDNFMEMWGYVATCMVLDGFLAYGATQNEGYPCAIFLALLALGNQVMFRVMYSEHMKALVLHNRVNRDLRRDIDGQARVLHQHEQTGRNYRMQIMELEDALTQQEGAARADRTFLQDDVNRLRREVNNMRDELEQCEFQRAGWQEEAQRLGNVEKQLNTRIVVLESESRLHRGELREAREDEQTVRRAHMAAMTRMTTDLEELRDEMVVQQRDRDNYRTTVNVLSGQNMDLREEMAVLRNSVAERIEGERAHQANYWRGTMQLEALIVDTALDRLELDIWRIEQVLNNAIRDRENEPDYPESDY